MSFIVLTFITAFAIEALGTYVSVIGLSALFGSNPVIIGLAVALDLGKIAVVSLLYKYWDKLGVVMKSYAIMASIITMVITSAGASAYLAGEFQKAIVGTQESSVQIESLKQQIAKHEERKKQIDKQIAEIPESYTANQRIRLMNQFKTEQQDLQNKIAAIDAELPGLQVQQIGVEAKVGPVLFVAKAFDIPVETAVKWVILMIVLVFDPLAVFLIVAGNFLVDQRENKKNKEGPSTKPKTKPTRGKNVRPVPPPNRIVRENVVPPYPAILVNNVEIDKNTLQSEAAPEPEAAPLELEVLPEATTAEPELALEPIQEAAPEPAPEIVKDVLEEQVLPERIPEDDVELEVKDLGSERLAEVHPMLRTSMNMNGVRVPKNIEREQITLETLGVQKPEDRSK